MAGALWSALLQAEAEGGWRVSCGLPFSRAALLHIHFSELREACLDRGGQSAAAGGGFLGGWLQRGGEALSLWG